MNKTIYRIQCISTIKTLVLITIILFITFSSVGCKKLELTSGWKDREITIDGENADWENALTYIENKGIAIGLLNDEAYLYACLTTGDRQILRQMITKGFTLWLDSEGGKGKTFGLKYPVGLMESGMPMRDKAPDRRAGQDDLSWERLQTLLVMSTTKLEFLGPGKNEVTPMALAELTGIDLKVGLSEGTFVYECKIPLTVNDSYPYGIGIVNGGPIGIGCEIPEIDRASMREEMAARGGGGMRGGGGGGGRMGGGMRGGGRMGGGGGGMRGRGFEMQETLKLWAIVQLASGNDSATK